MPLTTYPVQKKNYVYDILTDTWSDKSISERAKELWMNITNHQKFLIPIVIQI